MARAIKRLRDPKKPWYARLVEDGHRILSLTEKGKSDSDYRLRLRQKWYFANLKSRNVLQPKGVTHTKPSEFIKRARDAAGNITGQMVDGIWHDVEELWLAKQPTFFSEGYMSL